MLLFKEKLLFLTFSVLVANPKKGMYVLCMFITYFMNGHTYSKSTDQPGKVANPARGQLNRENEDFPVRVRA